MTRPPFVRWFGWSVVTHVALGMVLWFGLPHVDQTSLVESDAAVTVVALVDAPAPNVPTPTPNSPTPILSAPHLSPPLKKGGGGDLSLGPESQPNMAIEDEPVADRHPDSSLSTPDPAQPESAAARMDDISDPQNGEVNSLPPSPPSVHISETSSSAGTSTDPYRPLVLAILERAKRYPLLAQRRGLEGTVEIAFIISPDGRLSDPELIASSTHHVLDEATLAMVHRVGVVPPPPNPTSVRFPVSIQYHLDPCLENPPFEKGGLGGFSACTDEPPAHKN